jgi:aspartyl aminopeptidase
MQTKSVDEIMKCGKSLAEKFINFNKTSPSPYNAMHTIEKMLEKANFVKLKESDSWKIEHGGFYYMTRGAYSSIIAFSIPEKLDENKSAFKIIGTHSDSPCFRLAPKFDSKSSGFEQVHLQMYGGGLWHTWYDRTLILGGRVIVKDEEGHLVTRIYQSKKPVAKVPTLAIHLQTESTLNINKENDLKPIIATSILKQLNCGEGDCSALMTFLSKELEVDVKDIIDFDLCFADSQDAHIFGLYDEFISSPRIDNLFSVFTSVESIMALKNNEENKKTQQDINIIAMFDHEEVGSSSYVGADSEYIRSIMLRITYGLQMKDEEVFQRMLRRSYLLSSDMAHSVHPNFSSKHQSSHTPVINKGVVLKRNANLRYTTDSISGAIIRRIAEKNEVPLMDFIVRCDSSCGSTIGPMMSTQLGCLASDIGCPQLGMHSISETAGVLDFCYYFKLMLGFFEENMSNILPKDY